ncbi:DUF4350 domain-containing protein [Caldilinea sp.]|jgi:hypothetical protein|uniref:DUF4350 domain-containing protein n=1 Tax=Caldilinea sp. TaxID=2293560 RepID=UPI001B12797A|nr:DUF4350 domain-containing protein [Caldilinea sp.]MBO9392467.1 DUF4350 domain-containing protein [Caldilinea sp.]
MSEQVVFTRGRFPAIFYSMQAWMTPLAIAVLFALMILVALATTPPPEPIPYDLDAAHPEGLLALRLWLEALGYDVRRIDGLRFEIPEEARLIFVYPNQLLYTAEEAERLQRWVEAGGTLALIGPDHDDHALIKTFGVKLNPELRYERQLAQLLPLLPNGRAVYPRDWLSPIQTLDLSEAPQAIPALALLGAFEDVPSLTNPKVVVAVQVIGEGVVWHLAPGVDFTNRTLQAFAQGELLLALLRTMPERSVVAFDTYHLFGFSRVGERIATLQDWLYRTPTGWATLFALIGTGVFWALSGRRLGPPLAPVEKVHGREAAEYVRAMANLYRRAHVRAALAQYHAHRFKVGLARRRGARADLPDEEFLEALANTAPPLNDAQLDAVRSVLRGLSEHPDERRLVELANRIDALLESIR